MSTNRDDDRLRHLLDVGRALTKELDQHLVLDRILEAAREITGARYAALGVLDDNHTELSEFLTSGIDEKARETIGAPPRGRGVLGALIKAPRPLRIADVGRHPTSYGFPVGHPVMRSFLGVPVVIRGRVWGNLYVTEKAGGEFTEVDEEAAVILAEWAAIAIENARLYEISERRREELEKAFKGLEATRDIAVAIGGEIALEHVLELIAKRGRALVDARSLVIMLREGSELVLRVSVGDAEEMRGARLSIAESTSGKVLESRRPERISDLAARLRIAPDKFGVAGSHSALLVPMVYRGNGVGVLAAFDRGEGGDAFSEEDEQTLRTFAVSAATAVALAQSVQADRLRSSLAAAEAERGRWARELHDETLQGLGGLRVLLSSALRPGDPERGKQAMREAVGLIETEIGNLRAIITELRPAALDELGLSTALEALLDRHREQSGFEIAGEISLAGPEGSEGRLDPELESTIYRFVQEALTNVAKHAGADTVRVGVSQSNGEVLIQVQDDGRGFDNGGSLHGFGLSGMRERVSLAGGGLEIDSDEHGTLVKASLPVRIDDENTDGGEEEAAP